MPELDAGQALRLLGTMWRIRLFEEQVGAFARSGEVPGLVHLSIGQEGVAAAVCSQLRDDDAVYSGHRAHGHAIAKGAPLDRLMAELMGRDTGLCRGLGGSMHVVDVEHGFMGATGVVGGTVPIALGSALASRLRGDDSVAVVFFGDGAVQAGHFNETVNLATLWKLPLILVCENNGFAEFTPRSAHTNVERVSDVVAPYGVERSTVDGNDVAAVWDAFGRVPRVRARGRRPVPPRVPDASAARPLRGRRDEVRACVRRRRPDRALPLAVRRGRGGGGSRRGRGGGRAGGALRPGERIPAGRPHGARWSMPETTYIAAITSTLAAAMRADERVFVLGEDVAEGGPYTATAGLAEEFGTARVINTPISEAAITGVAIGAAQSGFRPVLEIMFVDFITLALDQLVNAAAKAHFMSGGQLTVPMVLRTQGGAGQRGAAQHSQSLESWLTHVPGLKVVMPSRPVRRGGAARLARSPIRIPSSSSRTRRCTSARARCPSPRRSVPIGEAATLRDGRDVTVVALSRLVHDALAAADVLAADGIEVEVIDPRTLVPLDLATIVRSVERTGRLVVAHEAVGHGGFGAEIAAQVQAAAFDYLDAPVVRVARRSRRSRSARRWRTRICRARTRSSPPCGRSASRRWQRRCGRAPPPPAARRARAARAPTRGSARRRRGRS